MPYLDDGMKALAQQFGPLDAGDLNYRITDLICKYLLNKPQANYCALNEVIGVLECVKLELYRRTVVPYEHKKMLKNGDVYQELNLRFLPAEIERG